MDGHTKEKHHIFQARDLASAGERETMCMAPPERSSEANSLRSTSLSVGARGAGSTQLDDCDCSLGRKNWRERLKKYCKQYGEDGQHVRLLHR